MRHPVTGAFLTEIEAVRLTERLRRQLDALERPGSSYNADDVARAYRRYWVEEASDWASHATPESLTTQGSEHTARVSPG